MLSTSDGHEPESLPVSVCMCCFWTEGHMTALSRNLNNLDDVSPLRIYNYCQIRKVLFSTHSGFSAFIPVYFLFQIATITVLEVSFDFTISPSLCPGVHLSCLYILNSEHLKHLNINTSEYTWSLFYVCFALVLILHFSQNMKITHLCSS